jgi:DNA-binding transcriptional LysR family regulator
MHVTLRQLKVFECVARVGSFTRAAEELYLSQSTVSMQMKQLGEAVGQPLLEQLGKRIVLTDAGAELLSTTTEIFETWSRFETTVADLRALRRGRLRIACVSTAEYFLPRLMAPFRERHPAIDVSIEVGHRDTVIERLARADDDLYIMGTPPQHFDIVQYAFLDNPLVAIASARHPLAGKQRIPLQRLSDETLLLRERGSGTRLATERLFREQGVELKDRIELDSSEAIKQAVAAGRGVAILSRHALNAADSAIAVLDVEGFPVAQHWHIVHLGGQQLSAAAQAFLDYLLRQKRDPLLDTSSEVAAPRAAVG